MVYSYHKQFFITILSNSHEYCQCLYPNVRFRGWKDSDKTIQSDDVIKQFGVSYNNYADYLCLKGDDKIGIPGIKKIGKVKARKYVEKYHTVEEMIKQNVLYEYLNIIV